MTLFPLLLSFLLFFPLKGRVDSGQTPVGGGSISGLVTTDDGVPPPFSPADVRIVVIPADAAAGHEVALSSTQSVSADWSFRFPRVAGAVFFRVTGLRDEWRLGAVHLGGRDVIDTPLELPASLPTNGLQMVLTRQSATLKGDVVDAHGAPAPDAFVLVFTEDEGRWGPASRFVTAVRADGDANFVVRGLPPASYLVGVSESASDGWDRRESLHAHRSSAVKLTLPVGVTTISLRIEH